MADIDGYLEIIRSSPSGESVRDAIIQCMNDINQDAAVELSKLVITGKLSKVNHPWKPGTGKAYSMVSLQITPDDGDEPTSTNSLTYSEFNVNNDTTPGAHPAPEGTVYNVVNVNVDFKQFEDNIADNVNIDVDDLEADHTYDIVVKTGYNATKKVTILGDAIDKKIKEKGGTIGPDGATYYPCTFYEDAGKQQVMQTVSVREGDDASMYITASPTPPAGKFLNGWSPATTNVRQKTEFIPKWADQSGVQPGEIADTWDEIFTEGSAKYGIGSWKNVDFLAGTIESRTFISSVDLPQGQPHAQFVLPKLTTTTRTIPMMQVAQGERGTISTWVSMEPFYLPARDTSGREYFGVVPYGYNDRNVGNDYWETSYVNQFLNTVAIQLMDKKVSSKIVNVTKATRGAKNLNVTSATIRDESNSLSTRTANAKLWLPSYGEIHSFFTTDTREFNGEYKDPNLWIDEPGSIDYYSRCPEFAENLDQYISRTGVGDRTTAMRLRTQTAIFAQNTGWMIASDAAILAHQDLNTRYYGAGNLDFGFFQSSNNSIFIGFCLSA